MWDMSDDPFEADLSRLFLQPSGEADPVRLRIAVLERLQQEDRRRQMVITAAAGLGAAIAASAVAASGYGASTLAVIRRLVADVPTLSLPSLPTLEGTPWLATLLALGLGAILATRAIRDV
jgi:hypothetical protein